MGAAVFGGFQAGKCNTLRVFKRFLIAEANDTPAAGLQIRGATRVMVHLGVVCASIEFDDEAPASAGEVGNVGTDDKLPGEARPDF